MADKKQDDYNVDILLADAMLRLTALERVLIDKGLVKQSEIEAMTQVLVEKVTKVVLDKLQTSQNLDDFVEKLGQTKGDGSKN